MSQAAHAGGDHSPTRRVHTVLRTPRPLQVRRLVPPGDPGPVTVEGSMAIRDGREVRAFAFAHRPSTARSPSSIATTSGRGNCPTRSINQDRSTSSTPSGTATQSLGRPVIDAPSATLPASPARSRFDVRGTTWVCQTSTPRTSSEETTTHGRRLSRSTQYTSPRSTTVRISPSARPRSERLFWSTVVQPRQEPRRRRVGKGN